MLWKVLSLPFVALRRHRKKQARARLIDGLDALHQGHWSRAEKQLSLAAGQHDVAAIARAGAVQAAVAPGGDAVVQPHLDRDGRRVLG